MQTHKYCQICNSDSFTDFLSCKDNFYTKEDFMIQKCNKCGLLFTNPFPDKNELGKYYKFENYISHSNNKKGLLNKIYYKVRKYNHKKKYQIISSLIKTGSIIDIGCATGEFLGYMKNKKWEVTGIEPDYDARNYAQSEYNINVMEENEISQLKEKSFDIVTLWHVLEHVPEPNTRLKEIFRILKDDGFALIALPNNKSYDAKKYSNFWAGYDVPRHLYHFDQNTAKMIFKKNDFKTTQIVPMKFDSFYISLLSQKYKFGKGNLIRAFFSGLKSNRIARKNENNYSGLIFILKKAKT